MDRSQAIAISILALLFFASVPVPLASAQGAYSENLQVFVSGSSALWYMTFGGINGSTKLASLEAVPGLSWYNVTAIKTTSWMTDFQVFGKSGYNLLPVPFTPPEGLFLSVGSDSFADANAAAAALSPFLLTSFISWSNGTGAYVFYAPFSFNAIVPKTLLAFIPPKVGGFASALIPSTFMSTSSPMVVLEGIKAGSGFDHRIVVGSITTGALDSLNRPNILGYFGSALTSLKTSAHSTTSSISIHILDGILRSHDAATISNNTASFTSSYLLTLPAGKTVTRFNATVIQTPVQLLAYRSINQGVLKTHDNVSVTVSMTDLSTTGQITGLNFNDSWWKAAAFQGLFKEVVSPSFPTTIAAGATLTPVYVLQYVGTTAERITMPASTITYSYSVAGITFKGRTVLNPVPLSLGMDDAVVFTYLTASGGFGKSVGSTQNLTVVAKNVGTFAASSVTVAGTPEAGLADHGGSATVKLLQSAQGLLGVNVTGVYTANYKNPNGAPYNSTTNRLNDVFSHASMKLGLPAVVLSETLAPLSGGRINLTLTFSTSNQGSANVTSFKAQGQLPQGLACGIVNGKGIACSSGLLSLNYTSIISTKTQRAYMKVNVSSPQNFVLTPFAFSADSSGSNETGMSNAIGIPTGLVLMKFFSPSQLFGGMSSSVGIVASNAGPFAIYNATVYSFADSFDTLTSTGTSTKTTHMVAPGGNLSFSYGVKAATSAFGNLTSTNVQANFYFEGAPYTLQALGPKVSIYQPLSVSITTSPSTPIEGKAFKINFVVTNPSGVPVSQVTFTLPVPSGLGLSQITGASVNSGILTITSSSLAGHASFNASAVGVASSGITVPFDKATLTFTYSGVKISGKLPPQGIAIGEDVTTRYVIPTGLVLIGVLATAFYLRRKTLPSVSVPQK